MGKAEPMARMILPFAQDARVYACLFHLPVYYIKFKGSRGSCSLEFEFDPRQI